MATLVAGLVAFVAVIIQIRSSSKQLQAQIEAQRHAELEEQKRRKITLAKAILIEIDGFYLYHLGGERGFRGYVDKTEGDQRTLNIFRMVEPGPFTLYESVAGNIGELDDIVAMAVVRFYEGAHAYLSLLKAYQDAQDRVLRGQDVAIETQAIKSFEECIASQEQFLLKLAYVSCRQLCLITGVKFERPDVWIAAERERVGNHTA